MIPVDTEEGGVVNEKPKAPSFPTQAARLLYNHKSELLKNLEGNPDSIPIASEAVTGMLTQWDYQAICDLFGRVCALEQELGMKVGANCDAGVLEAPTEPTEGE